MHAEVRKVVVNDIQVHVGDDSGRHVQADILRYATADDSGDVRKPELWKSRHAN
jgi:hypothetical protein